MRLFIAILLSEEMKKSLLGTLHDMKAQGVKGGFSPAANLHVTLAFIGETDRVEDVKKALASVSAKAFRISLAEPGMFGDTCYAGIKGNQGISGAAKAVRDALDEAGIGYDKKKFVPHITLVRKMTPNRKPYVTPKGEMMVKKISLMKSVMKDGKHVYTEIASKELD